MKKRRRDGVDKLVSQLKPTNMVLWGTVAEQYRIAEKDWRLEARQPSVFKKNYSRDL